MITKQDLLAAALNHVTFDGWSQATFDAAVKDTGADPILARAICPRGCVDLAVAFHHDGDAAMQLAYDEVDTTSLKVRERITLAVKLRLMAVTDKEAVRRGTTLFAAPQNAGEGTQLIWGTADAIWACLGDTSDDVNWYTKRATLSAVYGATVLFWLGDDSADHAETWAFLDRRIENVMQFEKIKGAARDNKVAKTLLAGPLWLMDQVKRPMPRTDVPGGRKS
ncbi:MAG: COQ9 family protein [Planktomarina sp.]